MNYLDQSWQLVQEMMDKPQYQRKFGILEKRYKRLLGHLTVEELAELERRLFEKYPQIREYQ